MGKCVDKENDYEDGKTGCNGNDDSAPPQGNNSKSCRDDKNPCELLKRTRTREGWTFRWITPQQTFVRSIIPGPFLRPKLVHALPYVVKSDCKDWTRKNAPERKLRSGIPDPWLEYLAWKENSSPEDVRSSWEYMWLTDYLWNSRGLAMVQGIPDPWRVDLNCRCFDVIVDELEETRKKPRRIRAKDRGEVSRALPERDSKGKADEKLDTEKKNRNAYERVKDKMSELDEELRLRDAEKKKISRPSKEAVKSKSKMGKSKKTVAEQVIDGEKPIKKIPIGIPPKILKMNFDGDKPMKKIRSSAPKVTKLSSRDDEHIKRIPSSAPKVTKVSFDGVQNQIMRCNDDIAKIREDTKLARHKIQKLKDKEPKRNDDKYALCAGKCGRVCQRNESLLKSMKLNDGTSSAVTTDSIASVKEFLKEIDNRIAITKNALNSPDLKNPEKQKSPLKRERGAGDNLNRVIDLQQPSLFTRRCDSEISIDRQASEIPDHVDIEFRCYRKASSLQSRHNRAAAGDNEVLIVESFSEQD